MQVRYQLRHSPARLLVWRPRGGDRVSLSGTPRHSPNRGTHRGFAPTFQVTIRQASAYSCTSAQ